MQKIMAIQQGFLRLIFTVAENLLVEVIATELSDDELIAKFKNVCLRKELYYLEALQ